MWDFSCAQSWAVGESWKYCIDYLHSKDNLHSFAVKYSEPTRRKPVPKATASVYFHLQVQNKVRHHWEPVGPLPSPMLHVQQRRSLAPCCRAPIRCRCPLPPYLLSMYFTDIDYIVPNKVNDRIPLIPQDQQVMAVYMLEGQRTVHR